MTSMARLLTLVIVFLATYVVVSAQETPKNLWQAQALSKEIFESATSADMVSSKDLTPRSAKVVQEPIVVLRSNLGEFSNASPSVEVRMDVVREYPMPVFVGVQIVKWSGRDSVVQGYTVLEGGLYGTFDRLPAFGSYIAYKATIPEAGFGDVYIYTVSIKDLTTHQVVQQVSTRVMVGGDGFGHRSIFYLNGAMYQNGFLYLRGSFPKVPKVWVRLGDPRNNSTGLLEGTVSTTNLVIVPLALPPSFSYSFPYDVVLHLAEWGESFTLPAGLKLEGALPLPSVNAPK